MISAVVAWLWLPALAVALDPAAIAESLPRHYVGTFQWRCDGNEDASAVMSPRKCRTPVVDVSIEVHSVRVLDDDRVEATGRGTYVTRDMTIGVDVKMVLSSATLAVEMWESNPAGRRSAGVVTDGSYRGKLAADLSRIDAEWTPATSRTKGDLYLGAALAPIDDPSDAQ